MTNKYKKTYKVLIFFFFVIIFFKMYLKQIYCKNRKKYKDNYERFKFKAFELQKQKYKLFRIL